MTKKHILAVIIFLFTTFQAFAHVLKLSPQESKSLTNHAPWTLNATCNIQGLQTKSSILVSIVENKGKINGKELSKGQATKVKIKANDSITVSAEPGATVHLLNLGHDAVEAVCYS